MSDHEKPTADAKGSGTPEQTAHDPPEMVVVGVRLRPAGKIYQYDASLLSLVPGDRVIIQGERGNHLATVASPPRKVPRDSLKNKLFKVIKKADLRDLAREESNLRRAAEARRIAIQRVRERQLPIKIIQCEHSFDGSKITIYFYAENRVDFRELVRDLTETLHTRIDMKQIGPRDETKMIGGLGPCGRELCCSSWLRDFNAVSVKMAKVQGLSLGSSKLTGMCGRLKCCLRYEYDTYVELGKSLPPLGSWVESVKGNGKVTRHNVLKQTAFLKVPHSEIEVEVTLDDLVQKKSG